MLCCFAASATLLRRLSTVVLARLAPVMRFGVSMSVFEARALTGRGLGLTMVSVEFALLDRGGGLEVHRGEVAAGSKER